MKSKLIAVLAVTALITTGNDVMTETISQTAAEAASEQAETILEKLMMG